MAITARRSASCGSARRGTPTCCSPHVRWSMRTRWPSCGLAARAGVRVMRVGPGPQWQETKTSVEPARLDWCAGGDAATMIGQLPRLVELKPDGADIRCTAWQRGNRCTRLLMNLRNTPADVTVDGKPTELAPGVIYLLEDQAVDKKGESNRLAVTVVKGGQSKVRPEDCLATLVGPGINQPDPFPGYGGFVGWVSPIRLSGGDWLVGFSAGYWHASSPTPLRLSRKTMEAYRKMGMPADIVAPTGGRAMIMRSTDEGKTWSKPATLLDTPDDDRHPGWVELPDGTLLCSLFTYPGAEFADILKQPENAYRTVIIRSFDHGKTWDKELIRPPSPFLADESDGPMVLLKDGSVLLTISGAPKGRRSQPGGRLHEPGPRRNVASRVRHQGRPRTGRGKRHAIVGRPVGHDSTSRGGHLLVWRPRPHVDSAGDIRHADVCAESLRSPRWHAGLPARVLCAGLRRLAADLQHRWRPHVDCTGEGPRLSRGQLLRIWQGDGTARRLAVDCRPRHRRPQHQGRAEHVDPPASASASVPTIPAWSCCRRRTGKKTKSRARRQHGDSAGFPVGWDKRSAVPPQYLGGASWWGILVGHRFARPTLRSATPQGVASCSRTGPSSPPPRDSISNFTSRRR